MRIDFKPEQIEACPELKGMQLIARNSVSCDGCHFQSKDCPYINRTLACNEFLHGHNGKSFIIVKAKPTRKELKRLLERVIALGVIKGDVERDIIEALK